MFKPISNFLHRTPWWAMFLIGITCIALLGVFTVPFQVMRLEKAGATPEVNRAIKREIDTAFAGQGLDIAEKFIEAFKSGTKDPERRAELENALEEIARAREELTDAGRAAREATREAADAAREVGEGARKAMQEAAAQSRRAAWEALVTARETALEGAKANLQAQREALRALKAAGIRDVSVERQMEQAIKAAEQGVERAERQLKSARDKQGSLKFGLRLGDEDRPAIQIDLGDEDEPKVETRTAPEAAAKDAGKGVAAGPVAGKSVAPKAPNPPAAPGAPAVPAAPKAPVVALGIGANGVTIMPPVPPVAPLPPELRADIREKVADDVFRLGLGAGLIMLFIPLFIIAIIAKVFIDRARAAQRVAETKKKEADFHSMHRQVTEAKLQALQAQVEPHFLYNTLANVQALTEADPAQANKMVEHLIQYLRSALPKMRENSSTVGQELDLARSYLNILKMRMGARLEFSIEAPDDVQKLAFPPLMLPSLVENAIKHGLEPQREGGRIDIVASMSDGIIRVEVRDTGRGFGTGTAGGGVGLANIRERLQGLFGDAGKLTLTENDPKGVTAVIEVPVNAPPLSSTAGFGAATGQPAMPAKPDTVPARIWGGVKTVHNVWAKMASFTFVALMIVLGVMFGVALVAAYTGWLPVNVGGVELKGAEGAALGTLAVVITFGALALVTLVVVALIYGLGVMMAGLVVFIPIVILVALVPSLSPLILIGLIVWWLVRRKKKQREHELPTLKI